MQKILITDKVHPLLIDGLHELGFEVHFDLTVSMENLEDIISKYSGIVINSKIKMNEKMIDLATSLKFIARLGSGMEIIDIAYAQSKGISVLNSPEGNRDAVAEHAIGMILALNNNLIKADAEVRNFEWRREENRGNELKGKTIGIIGLGNTGEAIARKLSSWQLNLISFDKYRSNYPDDLSYIEKVALEDILNRSDIITLHLPLTAETSNMVNIDFLQKCRKQVVIVNTSRGEIVNTKDLIEALKNKKIRGACLDVFENESVMSYTEGEIEMYKTLFGFDNVVLSPHIAGWTKESLEKIAMVVLKKIKGVFLIK